MAIIHRTQSDSPSNSHSHCWNNPIYTMASRIADWFCTYCALDEMCSWLDADVVAAGVQLSLQKNSKTKPVLGLRKGSTTNWLKINQKCYFNFIAVAHSIFKYESKLVFNELSFNRSDRSHRNALEGLNVLTTKWYNNIIINKRLAI